ncbi:hypothetical protein JCM10212_004080 [Sporobolomyces blumeae]
MSTRPRLARKAAATKPVYTDQLDLDLSGSEEDDEEEEEVARSDRRGTKRNAKPNRKGAKGKHKVESDDSSDSSESDDENDKAHHVRRGKGRKSHKTMRKGKGKPSAVDEVDEEDGSSSSDEPAAKKRRFARAKAKASKGKGKGGEVDSDEDASSHSESEAEPTNKKAARRAPSGQKRPIKANPLDSLPLEVLSEILSLTTPKDLLNVARTSKSYRALLLSQRRSATIWRASRRVLGLPDLTVDDFSEPAYAALVFGTACDACGRKAETFSDPWLRRRLCQPCRREHLILRTAAYRRARKLHPHTLDCVAATPLGIREVSTARSLKRDVDVVDQELKAMQEDDETIDSLPDAADENSDETFRSSRRRTSRSHKKRASRFKADEKAQIVATRRIDEFVKETRAHLKKVDADATRIFPLLHPIRKEVEAEEKRLKMLRDRETERLRSTFRTSIANRLAETAGYNRADSNQISAQSMNRLMAETDGKPMTVQRWVAVKARVLALIDKAKARQIVKRKEADKVDARTARRDSLRGYYDKLEDATTDPLFPLFADFLYLASVKSLWSNLDDETTFVDRAAWEARLDEIVDDIEEYSASVVDYAVRLILTMTREFASDNDLEAAVEEVLEGDLDEFFGLATSILVCDCNCRGRKIRQKRPGLFRKTSGFRGSLKEVFAHRRKQHNVEENPSGRKEQSEPEIRLALPLEISCAITALIEVGDLDPDMATVADLDGLDGSRLRWDNAMGGKKIFFKWKELVDHIDLAALKASKARPPVDFPPPVIIYTPRRRDTTPQIRRRMVVESDWEDDENEE